MIKTYQYTSREELIEQVRADNPTKETEEVEINLGGYYSAYIDELFPPEIIGEARVKISKLYDPLIGTVNIIR
jgi:hypothetical protein|tara:strand:+ start:889 stop:1107 length:219 start_codon:yes stop_codon:yes gene_type:complete